MDMRTCHGPAHRKCPFEGAWPLAPKRATFRGPQVAVREAITGRGALRGQHVPGHIRALIVIRPELNPARQPISEYAIFVAIKSQLQDRWGKAGLALLVICIIGTVGVGVFVADPIAVPFDALSTVGTLHVVFGTVAMMLLPFAALLINLSLARKNPAWAPARRALLWTSGLPLLGLMLFLIMVASVVPAEGWPPRFLFLTYMVWLITLASQAITVRGQLARDLTDVRIAGERTPS